MTAKKAKEQVAAATSAVAALAAEEAAAAEEAWVVRVFHTECHISRLHSSVSLLSPPVTDRVNHVCYSVLFFFKGTL